MAFAEHYVCRAETTILWFNPVLLALLSGRALFRSRRVAVTHHAGFSASLNQFSAYLTVGRNGVGDGGMPRFGSLALLVDERGIIRSLGCPNGASSSLQRKGLVVSTNRIPLWEELDVEPRENNYRVGQAQISTHAGAIFPHSMFMPLHYERKYAYPLIVWLHGEGDDEHQLRRVMPSISMRNYAAVAPRGTDAEVGWVQSPDGISLAEQCVLDCIAAAEHRFHIAKNRVFLVGYGRGGTMALRVALNLPDSIAGVVSLGGPFPSGHSPLLNIGAARDLPLLLSHGRASLDYPVDGVCRDLRLIHAAGLSVTLRQYPTGNELTPTILSDVDSWIMPLVTGQPAQSGASENSHFTEFN